MIKLIPFLNIAWYRSPTVLPLAEKGWSSIHTVLDKNGFGILLMN